MAETKRPCLWCLRGVNDEWLKLCPECQKELDERRHGMPEIDLDEDEASGLTRAQRMVKLGRCADCCKENDRGGYYCVACTKKRTEAAAIRREKKRRDAAEFRRAV